MPDIVILEYLASVSSLWVLVEKQCNVRASALCDHRHSDLFSDSLTMLCEEY